MEIVPGVHQFKLPLPPGASLDHVNAYLVESNKGNLLIDTGYDTAEAFAALRDSLRSRGFGFKDISQIVVTHIHPDHYGQADKLRQISGASLALSGIEERLIQPRYEKMHNLLKEVRLVLARNGVPEDELSGLTEAALAVKPFVGLASPDIKLEDGDKVPLSSSQFTVLLTPGHSPGHICLYEPERKFLFSGDHVLPDIFPHVGLHPQSGENPLGDFFDSLQRLEKLEVNFVFPGHGSVFSGFKLRVSELLYHQEQRQLAIIKVVRDEPKTAYQIANEIPWMPAGEVVSFDKLSTFDRRLAVMEALAHLKLLLVEGRAERITKENVDFYWAGG